MLVSVRCRKRLAEAAQADALVLEPRRALRRARLRREVRPALVKPADVAAGRGEPAHLAVLVRRVAEPVDARVILDGLVRRVNHDHLVPAVTSILTHPVAVEHAQAADLLAGALLRDAAEVAHGLHLVHARVARLAVHNALRHHLLAPAAADAGAEDHVALLRLVAEHAGLLRAARARAPADRRQLAVLPGTQPQIAGPRCCCRWPDAPATTRQD